MRGSTICPGLPGMLPTPWLLPLGPFYLSLHPSLFGGFNGFHCLLRALAAVSYKLVPKPALVQGCIHFKMLIFDCKLNPGALRKAKGDV